MYNNIDYFLYCYYSGEAKPVPSDNGDTSGGLPPIYLRCPANFSVSGIKKLVRAKYDLAQQFLVSCWPGTIQLVIILSIKQPQDNVD